MSWEAFVAALGLYKQRFSGKSRQDSAYVTSLLALEGQPMSGRAARAGEIVMFLNRWACRVSRAETPPMLAGWINEHADRLDRLSARHIADEGLAVEEIHDLYASLWNAGRAKVRNWSDAANSKALHQLVPALFVMWDNNVKRFALDYGDFTAQMHRLARRLIEEGPYRRETVEAELQATLEYPARKPLAKHLDELNIVRVSEVERGAPASACPEAVYAGAKQVDVGRAGAHGLRVAAPPRRKAE